MSVLQDMSIAHDADAILDYYASWTGVLASGETISTSSWTVVLGTAMLANSYNGTPGTTVTGTINSDTTGVWVVSASQGLVEIRNRIVTSAGRQYDRTFHLTVGTT